MYPTRLHFLLLENTKILCFPSLLSVLPTYTFFTCEKSVAGQSNKAYPTDELTPVPYGSLLHAARLSQFPRFACIAEKGRRPSALCHDVLRVTRLSISLFKLTSPDHAADAGE